MRRVALHLATMLPQHVQSQPHLTDLLVKLMQCGGLSDTLCEEVRLMAMGLALPQPP